MAKALGVAASPAGEALVVPAPAPGAGTAGRAGAGPAGAGPGGAATGSGPAALAGVRLATVGSDLLALTDSSALFADLGKLGATWPQLAAAVSKAAGQPIHDWAGLVQWLLANLGSPTATDVFATIGAAPLLTSLRAAAAKLAAILPNGAALLSPLSAYGSPAGKPSENPDDWETASLPGLVRIAPATFATAPAAGADLAVSFKLSADIAVEAGAQWPYAGDAMGAGFVMLAAEGAFAGSGAFRLPFSAGSLGIRAAGDADPAISYYFRPADPSRIFAAAVADVLPRVPDPFDPAAVWAAFALHDLAGMILTCDGHATANVDLTVGESGAWPGVLAADVKVSISLALSRKAAFALSLRRTGSAAAGTMAVIARLSRNDTAVDQWGLGVGIDLDPAPLIARVQPIVNTALAAVADADTVIARIMPFLSPGTWLRRELAGDLDAAVSRWVGDATVAAALEQDIALLTGTATSDTGGITKALTDAVTGAIDSAGDKLAAGADAQAQAVAGALVAAFPAITGITATVEADIAALLAGYEARLTAFAGELLAASGLPAIEVSLGRIGARVSDAVADVDKVLAGVRAVIATYSARVQAIVSAAKAAAQAKIALRLSYEAAQTDGTDYELTGTFRTMTGAAGELYRALAFGQLAGIQRAFGGQIAGFTLDPVSTVSRFSGQNATLGYDVVLLGMALSGQAVLTATATATVNARGDVTISGQGSDTVGDKSAAASRSLAFVTTYDFVAAGRLVSQARPVIKLGLSATIADRNLKRGEVSAFLGSVAAKGLISGERVKRANAVFDGWAAPRGGGSQFGGTMALTLNLDAAGVAAVTRAGQRIGDAAAASAEGLAQFRRAMAAMIANGCIPATVVRDQADNIPTVIPLGQLRAQFPDAIEFLYRVALAPGNLNSLRNANAGPHKSGTPRLPELADVMAAAHAFTALLAGVAGAAALDIAALGDGRAAAVRKADAAIADSAGPWLSWLGVPFLAMNDRVAPRTLALLQVLAGLAKGSDTPPAGTFDAMFTLQMTNTTTGASATV